jgi:hypothetical protein
MPKNPKANKPCVATGDGVRGRIPILLRRWRGITVANPFIRARLRSTVANAGFELPVMCSPDELPHLDVLQKKCNPKLSQSQRLQYSLLE